MFELSSVLQFTCPAQDTRLQCLADTFSRCRSGTHNEVCPHHHTAIMIHKITHKKLLPGGFHIAHKTTAYNLREFNFNLALEIQDRIPEKELFV